MPPVEKLTPPLDTTKFDDGDSNVTPLKSFSVILYSFGSLVFPFL